jgi:hypothetical protein
VRTESLVGYRCVCVTCGATGPIEEDRGQALRAALAAGWSLNAKHGDRCPNCKADEPQEGGGS